MKKQKAFFSKEGKSYCYWVIVDLSIFLAWM